MQDFSHQQYHATWKNRSFVHLWVNWIAGFWPDEVDSLMVLATSGDDLFHLFLGVSKNSGKPPQFIHLLIGFSIINHPFWGTPIFGNTLLNPKNLDVFLLVMFFTDSTTVNHQHFSPPFREYVRSFFSKYHQTSKSKFFAPKNTCLFPFAPAKSTVILGVFLPAMPLGSPDIFRVLRAADIQMKATWCPFGSLTGIRDLSGMYVPGVPKKWTRKKTKKTWIINR